jgi:hypothetical protein
MAELENRVRDVAPDNSARGQLQSARDLYIVGGKESDRQAMEILLKVFEKNRDASGRVPLDMIDSLPQLVDLLISQGENEKAGQWAASIWNSVKGNEQWLKSQTLQDCYVWASKGFAFSGRFKEALAVEQRCIAHVAPRAERPTIVIVQSLYRAAVYDCQEGDTMRALIKATKACDFGYQALQGTKEDAQMLFDLLLFTKHLQEKEHAPKWDISRTRNRIRSTTLRIIQLEG